jgi:small nuclear ribonucleoprotein (snRNP)-like protein
MSLLQKFRTNRTKVKVYVRKEHGIRGYVTGYIEAFDKHYNLALSECIETWKRRKFKFSEAKIVHSNPAEDCSKILKEMNIEVPAISVKSLNRKYVECTREMGQLMIRGENVVLISEFKLVD